MNLEQRDMKARCRVVAGSPVQLHLHLWLFLSII